MTDYSKKYPCFCTPFGDDPDPLQRHVEKVMHERHEHLEKYAAAFLRQVGSEKASEYVLIEQQVGLEWRWFFKHKEDVAL